MVRHDEKRKKRKISKGKMSKMKISELLKTESRCVCESESENENDFYFDLHSLSCLLALSVCIVSAFDVFIFDIFPFEIFLFFLFPSIQWLEHWSCKTSLGYGFDSQFKHIFSYLFIHRKSKEVKTLLLYIKILHILLSIPLNSRIYP